MEALTSTKSKKVIESSGGDLFISSYHIPPTEEISIEQFQDWAMNRVRVLKEIDNAKISGIVGKHYQERIDAVTRQYLPLKTEEDVQRDIDSHFILRLAYCKPADKRWFIDQECSLLQYRLERFSANVSSYMKNNNLKSEYQSASNEELQKHSKDLDCVGTNWKGKTVYKLPFEEALALVRGRRVVLSQGFCYVSEEDFTSILVASFRARLDKELDKCLGYLKTYLSNNDSIAPIINHISNLYFGSDFQVDPTKRVGKVTPADIDMLSARSFPLCMNNLHEKLRENHHLKHGGRMQYGLFLKGIGLSLEDALVFWRAEFTKIMGVDKFDKEYTYNIRHNYGKEGKRTDYTPYSCGKIIKGDTKAGEHHGCPFRHFDEDHLSKKMASQNVPESSIKEVLKLVKDQHYQVACRKHFEVMHPKANSSELIITHPNQYYDESEKYFNGTSSNNSIKSEKESNNNNNNNNSNSNSDAATGKYIPKSVHAVLKVQPKKSEEEKKMDAALEGIDMDDLMEME